MLGLFRIVVTIGCVILRGAHWSLILIPPTCIAVRRLGRMIEDYRETGCIVRENSAVLHAKYGSFPKQLPNSNSNIQYRLRRLT
jgi:hypothetical protein